VSGERRAISRRTPGGTPQSSLAEAQRATRVQTIAASSSPVAPRDTDRKSASASTAAMVVVANAMMNLDEVVTKN